MLVILTVAAAPAAASTLPRSLPLPRLAPTGVEQEAAPPPPGGFVLQASDGYRIFVAAVPARKGNPAVVALFAAKRNEGAVYVAPATVTETSFQADLGSLGEIAVAFHPSGATQVVRSECGEEPVSLADGTYEGKIDFHGEQGYTTLEATQAPGDISFFINLICPGISGIVGPPYLPGAELDVDFRSQSGANLKVVKNRPTARAHFEVGISELREGIAIERSIAPIEGAGTFRFDKRLKTATVRPPAPFSGSARYRRAARPANRWRGDLTVDLPGREDVKLVGSDLRAHLAPAHWDWNP